MTIQMIPLTRKIDGLCAFLVEPDPSKTVTKDFERYKVRESIADNYIMVETYIGAVGVIYKEEFFLYERKHYGWSVEQILTTPAQGWKIKCKDHLGNEYESITAMAEYWALPDTTIRARLARGVSLEEALTKPLRKQRRKGE